jgi:hypothetical protein
MAVGLGFSYLNYRRRQSEGERKYHFPVLEVFIIVFSIGGIFMGMNPPWLAIIFWTGLVLMLIIHRLSYNRLNNLSDRFSRKVTKR